MYELIRCFANGVCKASSPCMQRNRRRGNGACRSDPVRPTGTQHNARSIFARFCVCVFLPFLMILAKWGESTHECKRSTETLGERHYERYERVQTEQTRIQRSINGVQKPLGTNIPSGTNGEQTEYKRGTKEYKRVETVWYVSQGFSSVDSELQTDWPVGFQFLSTVSI